MKIVMSSLQLAKHRLKILDFGFFVSIVPNFAGKSCRSIPVQGCRGFYRRRLSFFVFHAQHCYKIRHNEPSARPCWTRGSSRLRMASPRQAWQPVLVLVSRRRLAGPFQCVEYLGFLPVFGPVFHLAGFPIVVHTFLGERCSDNILEIRLDHKEMAQ